MTRSSGGRLAGTTALVTGASQGLGRAIALAYAREGAALVLVARRPEPLERVRAEAEALGARAVAVAADVGDPDDVERVAAAALTAFDRVDALVNNASELGPTPMPYLLDTDPDALRRVLDVNLLGPFLLTRALLGPMLAAGRGSVINVSSDAGVVGYPGWGAYGVSKAALDQMTRIWASELEDSGVRVNAVDPGDMATAMHAAALPDEDPAPLARAPAPRARRGCSSAWPSAAAAASAWRRPSSPPPPGRERRCAARSASASRPSARRRRRPRPGGCVATPSACSWSTGPPGRSPTTASTSCPGCSSRAICWGPTTPAPARPACSATPPPGRPLRSGWRRGTGEGPGPGSQATAPGRGWSDRDPGSPATGANAGRRWSWGCRPVAATRPWSPPMP